VADIDQAPVIRAHDLGEENWRIFDYYARKQPTRFFYLYDRLTRTLTPLGYATELAQRTKQSATTTPASYGPTRLTE
jgi:hypothetical protein